VVPPGSTKCDVFNEAALCTLFLTCNISQCSPKAFVPKFFFLSEHACATLAGIVFEVAFGGVSDGVGTNCIRCA
jgi:hypothetical protein